jgi:PKD repeat protein
MHRLPSVFRRGRRRSRGQSLVEFAIILPLFMLFVAAVLDLGRVFYANITLTSVAREGAFAAAGPGGTFQPGQSCDPISNSVVCRVQLESKNSMVSVKPADVTMTCAIPGCPKIANSMVTVGVSGDFRLITPLLAGLFGGQTIKVESTATAQMQYLPDPTLPEAPPGPTAAFTGCTSTAVDVGVPVSFDGSTSTGEPSDWVWDFGDGTTANGETVSHAWSSPGPKTVTLTVVNITGSNQMQVAGCVTVNGVVEPPPPPPPTTCYNPPYVIGQNYLTAADNIRAVTDESGTPVFQVVMDGGLTSGPKLKVQAQTPDATECLNPSTQSMVIRISYRAT